MPSGIYTITSLSRRKVYVGSAVDISARRRLHLHELRKNTHHSTKLQRAFNTSGESDFVFDTLFLCSRENLIFYEQRAIDVINPWFNENKRAGSMLGHKHSEETRKKLRESHLGNKPTDEARKNHIQAMKKYASSDEVKKRLSLATKGRKQSAEEIERRVSVLRGLKRDSEAVNNMVIAQRKRRGIEVDDEHVVCMYEVHRSVRKVSNILGISRELVSGIVKMAGRNNGTDI